MVLQEVAFRVKRSSVFEERDIWIGADIAKGPEDWNWHLRVNHPW